MTSYTACSVSCTAIRHDILSVWGPGFAHPFLQYIEVFHVPLNILSQKSRPLYRKVKQNKYIFLIYSLQGSIMMSLLIPFVPSQKPVISEIFTDFKNTGSWVIDDMLLNSSHLKCIILEWTYYFISWWILIIQSRLMYVKILVPKVIL